ncbi:hypothetical protein [Streptomyces sp. TLI_146]|uniref:hypothetical protein n=1 Tax=Streptomyces sp. TLI_146 TaxID=1938858 RepID=UPI000C70BB3A|nr:hypothetical protein [Streptomyces sp. TLI_146]PKV89185.1 hypothetical protein BX283_6819 [Streptomyces sp. TLI_146]
MSGRGELFLGDLARAVAELRPADLATAAAMAALLGQGHRTPTALSQSDSVRAVVGGAGRPRAVRLEGASGGPLRGTSAQPPRTVTAERTPRPAPPEPSESEEDGAGHDGEPRAVRLAHRPVDFSLTAIGGPAPPAGEANGANGTQPGAGLPRRRTAAVPLTHEPPWKKDWARGIMFAAVATPVESREVDQRALLRGVAGRQALRAVPRRRRLSTRRGVQLLLDHGPGMAPFRDDGLWLRDLVGSIAGRDRIEVLRFRGAPGRGVVRNDPLTIDPYRPPPPGTPVILFSDLGRMRPPFAGQVVAGPREWRAFVHTVAHSGCPVICLTPYESTDYPALLRKKVAFVPLDRRVSLRHAQRATARVRGWLERP